jgi:hypothetical protein
MAAAKSKISVEEEMRRSVYMNPLTDFEFKNQTSNSKIPCFFDPSFRIWCTQTRIWCTQTYIWYNIAFLYSKINTPLAN